MPRLLADILFSSDCSVTLHKEGAGGRRNQAPKVKGVSYFRNILDIKILCLKKRGKKKKQEKTGGGFDRQAEPLVQTYLIAAWTKRFPHSDFMFCFVILCGYLAFLELEKRTSLSF